MDIVDEGLNAGVVEVVDPHGDVVPGLGTGLGWGASWLLLPGRWWLMVLLLGVGKRHFIVDVDPRQLDSGWNQVTGKAANDPQHNFEE